jgi:hypothetical protein
MIAAPFERRFKGPRQYLAGLQLCRFLLQLLFPHRINCNLGFLFDLQHGQRSQVQRGKSEVGNDIAVPSFP